MTPISDARLGIMNLRPELLCLVYLDNYITSYRDQFGQKQQWLFSAVCQSITEKPHDPGKRWRYTSLLAANGHCVVYMSRCSSIFFVWTVTAAYIRSSIRLQ